MNNQTGFTHILVLSMAFVLVISGCFLFLRLNNNDVLESEIIPESSPLAFPTSIPTVKPSGIPLGPQSEAIFNKVLENKQNTPSSPDTVQTMIAVDPTDWSLPINISTCYPEEKRIERNADKSRSLTFKKNTDKECIFTYTNEINGENTDKECTFPKSLVILDPKNTIFELYCKQTKSVNLPLDQ